MYRLESIHINVIAETMLNPTKLEESGKIYQYIVPVVQTRTQEKH